MKKIFKSAILTLLSLIVILSVFPTSVFASDSSTFEPRLTAPSRSNAYYNRELNVYSQCGYGMPNCIAYAYGRIYEITGEAPKFKRGSANELWGINKRNGYYKYGQEPKLGAIAVWSNHVGVVEKIDGKTVTTSNSHWKGNYFDISTFTTGTNRFGQKFYGYIYASDDYFDKIEAEKAKELAKLNTTYKMEKAQYKTLEEEKANHFAVKDIFETEECDILISSRMLPEAMVNA